jgi:broad specificity phosphatase PhoE
VIAARHGLPVVTVDALREISLGNWEGMTIGEVAARYPDRLAARRRDPLHVAPEGGETILEAYERAMPTVRAIVAAHPGETVAVVAHGAVNKTILLSVLGSPLASYRDMRQDNAAINVLEWNGSAPRVVAVNKTAHLDGLRPPRADSPETPAAPQAYTPPPPRE